MSGQGVPPAQGDDGPRPAGGDPAWARRRAMVAEQIERRGVRDPAVLAAMRTVPRHLFVPPALAGQAYDDRPLAIGHDQTISQPYVVAAMTEALAVGAGDRVLEIGTGSGYQAAVLAEVASEVHTIERVPELAASAAEHLARLRYDRVHVHVGDGWLGWSPAAPYDGIVVTCGGPRVPPALEAQLAPGRRLVMPVGGEGEVMELRVRERHLHDDGFDEWSLMPVRFVPFVTDEPSAGP